MEDALRIARGRAAELDTRASEQLVERERLRNIVVRPELEPAKLRREVGASGQNHDRQIGLLSLQLAEHGQPVALRQQEIEHREVVRTGP